MARLSGVPNAIYEAFAEIRDVASVEKTSALFGPRNLWTTENLQRLHAPLVEHVEKSSTLPLARLRPVVEPLGSESIQLIAELLYAQQLFAAAKGLEKLRNVRQVLSWLKTPLEVPRWAVVGVEIGVADDECFDANRLPHLIWLIEMLLAWRATTKTLLNDPWRFRTFVHGVDASRHSAQPMQEAWMHIMLPEPFENISSLDDKLQIRDAFRHVLDRQPSENIDADLLAIRWGLTKTLGVGFDFYSKDVAVNWCSKSGPLLDVSHEAIMSALERFDQLERNAAKWEGWEKKAPYKFALSFQGRLYPPKHIVSLATKRSTNSFSGGEQTNSYLEGRGFSVVALRDATQHSSPLTQIATSTKSQSEPELGTESPEHDGFSDPDAEREAKQLTEWLDEAASARLRTPVAGKSKEPQDTLRWEDLPASDQGQRDPQRGSVLAIALALMNSQHGGATLDEIKAAFTAIQMGHHDPLRLLKWASNQRGWGFTMNRTTRRIVPVTSTREVGRAIEQPVGNVPESAPIQESTSNDDERVTAALEALAHERAALEQDRARLDAERKQLTEERERASARRASATNEAPPEALPANPNWLDQLPEHVRPLFRHLDEYGQINEQEALRMLGGPRQFRKFSNEFDTFLKAVPFSVRVETAAGIKAYVRCD